ncbi:MAG: ParB/RepB/Spo0J family partition protein [Alphaproteobacteria bacterium]|nr:ParB/RepB/Spo0J family partition protein [Alphaproteobacteria bacterium]
MGGNNTLGRGLSALLGDIGYENDRVQQSLNRDEVLTESLYPGKMQPRQNFDPEKLEALVESVKSKGILQPILVRRFEEDKYEIIAGERRWRAAQTAGLKKMPVIILDCSDSEALEIGLIENLQRDDLNPVEEAESLQRLLDQHNKTQEEVAQAISKSRSYVANMLRLNQLPDGVKKMLRDNVLTAGHARSLLNTDNIEELANKIVSEKLTVREAESLAKKSKTPPSQSPVDQDAALIAEKIGEAVRMKAKLNITRQGGTLTLYFREYDQLDDLLDKLQVN